MRGSPLATCGDEPTIAEGNEAIDEARCELGFAGQQECSREREGYL